MILLGVILFFDSTPPTLLPDARGEQICAGSRMVSGAFFLGFIIFDAKFDAVHGKI